MPNEVLLYSPILSFVAESFIEQLNDFEDEDVTIRINSPGGSVFAGWGMVAKIQEHTGDLKIKVDGNASSMASILLLFEQDVEALNVSKFTLHRASVDSEDEATLKLLDDINKDIRDAFESKLNIPEFERISGVTLDDFFNSDQVIDVNIDAKQAKKIGLINNIKKLEAADFQALNTKFMALANQHNNFVPIDNLKEEIKNNVKPKNKKMTIEKLKAEHPEIYAQVFNAGSDAGTSEEKDRVGSWMAFVDADIMAVSKGIKEGNTLTHTAMAELSRKAISAEMVQNQEEESQEEVVTETITSDPTEPTATKEFENELDELLKIK